MKEPAFVNKILQVFLDSIEWTSLKIPIHQIFTYRCQKIEGTWEIIISPWLHEIYGGKYDGAIRLPSYEINLMNLANEFDNITYIGFDTDRLESSIEGQIGNNWATLILRKQHPTKNKTRKKVNTFTGEITKIFEKA